MDDLQFRRAIYADPDCSDEAVKLAAAKDSAKQEFWNEMKQLDADLKKASKVEVPEGLAHNLILRQSIQRHAVDKKRTRVHLALAASIAFVFGISFTLWQQPGVVNLSEHALAHVYHEGDGFALKLDGDVDLGTVNAKLASLGTQITEKVGRIYFANFCNFEGIRSFHMVMQGENGKVTVFLVPENDSHVPVKEFSDGTMHGETLEFSRTRLIMVGEEGKSFDKLKSDLSKRMQFSA